MAGTSGRIPVVFHLCDPLTARTFSWELHGQGRVLTVKTRSRLCVNDASMMLSECLAGSGVVQVFAVAARGYLQRGELVNLFPQSAEETHPLYALYPSRKNLPMKVRAFVDFMAEMVR